MGGYLYPYGPKTGLWAFTNEKSANDILRKIKSTDGIGLVMSQAPEGITGSMSFYKYMEAEIQNAVDKGASPKELIDYINKGQKPKVKQKCRNELTRRGVEIVWVKPESE